jgi:hypothetical protein
LAESGVIYWLAAAGLLLGKADGDTQLTQDFYDADTNVRV